MDAFSRFSTVPDLLAHRARDRGDAIAVRFEDDAVSYAELEERTARVQGWLERAGVRPGDRIVVLMGNSQAFVDAWLGIARAGAIAVPANTALVGEPLAYVLEHSGSVGVIADADLMPAVDRVGDVPGLAWRVVCGGEAPGATSFRELLDADPVARAASGLGAGSPMTIVYTSGTTGMPKGVVLPHRSYTNTGAYFARHLGLGAGDHMHTCLPLFHCNAQQCTLMPGLEVGIPVSIDTRFSVSRFWSWIERSQATVSNLLGAMLTLLAKVPERPGEADNTLRIIPAAPIPEPLHRPFEERFGLRLIEGYGLSETGTIACINPLDDMRAGTIGLPLEYNELRIVDEQGAEVGPGTPGEIVTRTRIPYSYMLEYFRDPEKTAEAMRDGWFHTGDLGKRREDGYYVFLDRLKDTIRRRGENISSFQVEKCILDHPDVLQCAAIGVPSELSEEDVKVVIVVREGSDLSPEQLIEHCRERLADFMVPRYVETRAELPLTETGRVHKFKLREDGVGAAWDREQASAR